MKLKILCFLAVASLFSCSTAKVQVHVANPLDSDRLNELVEVNLESIPSKIRKEEFIIKNASGEEVPYQITSEKKLIFPAGVYSRGESMFRIEKGIPQKYKTQTYARFIQERKDDFAWENDKVAFRMYGPALVALDGPSNGIDIWYKRTSDMVIDKWYKNDLAGVASYHEDHGEGLDDYKVGRTLGAGAMAPFSDGKLWLNQNYETQEILDNGPLRTTFKLTYRNLDINGQSITESRLITLDAGSNLSKITQTFGTSVPFEVAAGVVKRPGSSPAIAGEDSTFFVYEEPANDKAAGIYIGLLNPQGWKKIAEDTYKTAKGETHTHSLGITMYQPGMPVTYYTGFGWRKFGFNDKKAFEEYLNQQVLNLNNPLIVTVK